MNVLEVIGTAAGKLDCITPARDLQAAQRLLDAGRVIAELIDAAEDAASLLVSSEYETDKESGESLRAALAAARGTP